MRFSRWDRASIDLVSEADSDGVMHVKRKRSPFKDYTDFECERELIDFIERGVSSGFGFVYVSGFPVHDEPETTKAHFRETLSRIGAVRPQNSLGDLVGEMTSVTRGDDWFNEIPFHTDGADLLSLLCIQPAVKGGELLLASALTAHNIMQDTNRKKCGWLFDQWPFHRGNRPGPTHFTRPIFSVGSDGTVDCFFLPGTLRETLRRQGISHMNEKLSAIDELEHILKDEKNHIRLLMQPGDLLVSNNKKVLHSRLSYSDRAGFEQRTVWRMWLDFQQSL